MKYSIQRKGRGKKSVAIYERERGREGPTNNLPLRLVTVAPRNWPIFCSPCLGIPNWLNMMALAAVRDRVQKATYH